MHALAGPVGDPPRRRLVWVDVLARSSDGRSMYTVDTLRRMIFVGDHEPGTGVVGERRVHPGTDGALPDGLAPDSGRLSTARLDVPGLPVPAWSGASL
jgi:sugar lactone lactonase YvrE